MILPKKDRILEGDNLMKAIKIDSQNKKITEIDIAANYTDMQKVVEGYICLAFDYPDKKNSCYVNDEGMLNNPEFFFFSKNYPKPLAGNAIIVGTSLGGNLKSCNLDIDEVEKDIKFFTLREVQRMIRCGLVNYNTYITTEKGTEVLRVIDLDAFKRNKNDNKIGE